MEQHTTVTILTIARKISSKIFLKIPGFSRCFPAYSENFKSLDFVSSQFVKKSFFGGKGGFIMGGMLLFGSVAKPLITGAAKKQLSGKTSVFKPLTGAIGNLLARARQPRDKETTNTPPPHQEHLDITYHTPLLAEELLHGKVVQVVVYAEHGEQTLKVSIPPGSSEGQK